MWKLQYPYNDALVVTMGIANHNVHCVLINSGSFVNIFNWVAYSQMHFPSNRLRPSPTLLYDFLR